VLDDAVRDVLCRKHSAMAGVIRFGGSVGLVQQTPWIQNMTIRDNILFGLPLDEARYNRAVAACQLESDLELLKGGDLTEIGEKGINLSGGQKARISLARAVYADCDIVLMDDPVSALDAGVKQKVFEQVFCGELRGKTRVLVTHAVDFLHLADRIVVMSEGKVKYQGSYRVLENSDEIRHVIDAISKKTHVVDEEEKHADESFDDIIDEDSEESSREGTIRKSFLSVSGLSITEDENEERADVNWNVYMD